MKKYLGIMCFSLIVTVVSAVVVSAGYNLGPNNIFHMECANGINLQGAWTQGTMSNGAQEAYNYEKQVYAREGNTGTYSEWAPKSQASITHRDYGGYTSGYAEVKGYWR